MKVVDKDCPIFTHIFTHFYKNNIRRLRCSTESQLAALEMLIINAIKHVMSNDYLNKTSHFGPFDLHIMWQSFKIFLKKAKSVKTNSLAVFSK